MNDPVVGPGTPPAKPPVSLEGILAQRANEAMAQGADAKAATDILGKMVAHLRSNPEFAKQGETALANGASPSDVAGVVWQHANAPSTPQEGLGTRVIHNVGNAVKQLRHPLDMVGNMAKGALEDLGTVASSMNAGMGQPSDLTPERAKEVPGAMLRTGVNLALPGIAGGATKLAAKAGAGSILSHITGAAAAGGAGGAAYTPDDPVAGGIAGALLGPVFSGAAKGGARLGGKLGSAAVDIAGRPVESRPIIKAGPVKLGTIEGVGDKAARLNAQGLERANFFTDTKPDFTPNDKPIAPADMHISAQRMARGLKTSSAGAEAELRSALEPRAEGAVDRVISHGLETTGLKSRQSGLQTVDDLIAQRTQHGNENFQPVFAKHTEPLRDPEFAAILKTPAGKQAMKRGLTIAANRGEDVATAPTSGGVPEGFSPEQWAKVTATMQERGLPVPEVPSNETVVTPTLKQAHYIKLGFDDMLNSAPEPGSGGSGPNNAAAIRTLKNRWLTAMDRTSPEYGTARKVFADESDLIRAGETGRNLFKMHPDEAAKAFRDMSDAERDVARRTGFDALAERVENGPENVGKGIKVRDQKRMRLLFPDDASFQTFQEGLKQEAQMHATNKGVLSGSNTADKLADMADMAGVTLPEVLHAASGRIMPLVKGVASRAIRAASNASTEKVNVERAKLLTAGAGGDATARLGALEKMGKYRIQKPSPAP